MRQLFSQFLLTASFLNNTYVPSEYEAISTQPTFRNRSNYVEFIPGNFPIIITAPHGGYLMPVNIPERKKSPNIKLLGDLQTQEIARQLVDYLGTLGKRPYLVICHLGRAKVDVNREPGKEAYDSLKAATVYMEYHKKVSKASEEVNRIFGTGLYLDIHGHRHPENCIELGYLINSTQLDLPDNGLNSYSGPFSLSHLLDKHPSNKITDLIRGKSSFGGLLSSLGYKAVPSSQYTSPNGGKYYRGGYSTYKYWKVDRLDTLQVELPASIRFDVKNRGGFIHDLAQTILEFGSRWYGWSDKVQLTDQVQR
ncbi:hypothetical protein K7432_001065 [Basidiobolus ranarum]|uniref:N-formylglutamate amidohydrolase n=1 Tax=Basidiobolus ranarum TaxID=34480 RepID=A0ABR2WA72_9FUNG